MADVLRMPTRSHIVYYLELFKDGTNPNTTSEPFKRLGPFERPIALTDFGTFENGYDDDDIGTHVESSLDIIYIAQPDDEEGHNLTMVRIVAEVVS